MLKGEWRYPWPVESHFACAAEIAKLAGLVAPKGAGHDR